MGAAFDHDRRRDGEAIRPSGRAHAMREHSLLSLFELNRQLSVRFEARRVVDIVVFNLMGHFGTPRSALWLAKAGPPESFEMVRAHGIPASTGAALADAFMAHLPHWSGDSADPVPIDEAGERLDAASIALARASGIAVLGALPAHGAIIGFVALGSRADGQAHTAFELEALRSSLGMVGTALENSRLYHEVEERNRRLAEAYRDLLELNQMKTEFVQNVNHELLTPLSVIAASVECLAESPDPDAKRHRLLTLIHDETHKLSALVHSVLELHTVESHQESARVEITDVTALVERYALEHLAEVTQSHRTLSVVPSPRGLCARIAAGRMHKALDLLLDNAIKFTPEGACITLAVTADPTGEPWVHLTFADDGPGIPATQLSRVFRPFFQVDGSATRAAGGLGIGLALVQQLIAAMGGRIEAESPPGGGTLFRVRLPRSDWPA